MKTPRPQLPDLALAAGLPGLEPAVPTPAALEPARLLIKVCGMRDANALQAVAALKPDFLGFIFAPASPRYVGEMLAPEVVQVLPWDINRVGVFVNETTPNILDTARRFGLGAVQLHGQESPAQCEELNEAGLLVLKAFSVGRALDVSVLSAYVPYCDFFVFDTQGAAPGGNGTTFDWQLLKGYNLPVPYLLAGGIGPEHATELADLQLPGMVGIDLNSRFETAPGVKDANKLAVFFSGLKPR